MVLCISLFVVALVTIAWSVFKVWKHPRLLERAGISKPKMFILLYAISFLSAKTAALFFMMQGHIPEAFHCTAVPVSFSVSEAQYKPMADSESMLAGTNCTFCFPESDRNPGEPPAAGCDDRIGGKSYYYACETSCTKLFFTGAGSTGPSLALFVLAPLVWLPFSVYANNEVAQLIDGVWADHAGGSAGGSSYARIGLSTTPHGYYTIVPLVHSMTLGCAALVFIFVLQTHGSQDGYAGYLAVPPEQDISLGGDRGLEAVKGPLRKTCNAVTAGTVLLNAVMLCRVALEVGQSLLERGMATLRGPSPGRGAPLLSGSESPLAADADADADSDGGGRGAPPSGEERAEGVATAFGVALALFGGAE